MQTETNTTAQNQIMINAIQHRANNHGFALAMREPPTTTEQIRRVMRTLDSIITYLD
jgi:pyrroloquinoline quinone (PQQ) biosynthesis protein C